MNNDSLTRQLFKTVGAKWLEERADPMHRKAIMDEIRNYMSRDKAILDICCGYGRLTIPLLEAGYNVVGIDISEDLIRKGLKYLESNRLDVNPFLVANMKALPFRDEMFDFSFCVWASFNFLITESEQVTFLQEMFRTLKKGGSALIECPLHKESDDSKRICVENVSYLYCPITVDDMKRICGKSLFFQYNVFVEQLAGRDRMLCLLSK